MFQKYIQQWGTVVEYIQLKTRKNISINLSHTFH